MGEESPKRSRRRKRHEDSSASDSSLSSSTSSDETSEEERRRKRRRKEKRSKHHSRGRDKHKRKKRRRHSSDDDDSESESERRRKKKLLKDAKKILKEAKKSDAQKHATSKKFEKISEDDYYLKSNEFAAWLKDARRIYFSNLTTEEARKLFVEFVDAWNDGKLADKFYEGIKTGQRTNHKWNIKVEDAAEKEEEWERNKKKAKLEQKKYQKEHELVMDELLPKATGKDRLFEKKAIERQQKRERELSPEPMKESDMMGGGDDFKQMLARDRARREKRAAAKFEAVQSKVSAAEEREVAAMDQFRALINTAGGKITIQKRAG